MISIKCLSTLEKFRMLFCLSDHSYNTRFSNTNLPVPFFGTTAGQRTTHYQESALWNGLKADLKDLSGPGAFRAAVRRCLLAGDL